MGEPVEPDVDDAGPGMDASDDAGADAQVPPLDAAMSLDADTIDDAATGEDAGGEACPAGHQLCDGACVDLTAVDSCGSCDNDCTALPNVRADRVRCLSMRCALGGACVSGFGDCNGMPEDGCESSFRATTSCGGCGISCSGETPLCSASSAGAYRCTAACDGRTPDRCGDVCTDVTSDPLHCGGCDRACPTGGPNTRATCTDGVCGIACAVGYHECDGVCVSDDDPASCGSSCTPCPTPTLGHATCTAGVCGVACPAGAMECGGDCVDISNSAAHCGGCDRPCDGVCVGGVCDTGVRLMLETGAGQTAYPDELLPVAIVVRARDAAMNPVAGAVVTFTAPPGAVVMPATATTDSLGRAAAVARLGRALGTYRFEAMTPMALGPVAIEATAVAPPAGTLFPIANVARTRTSTGTPGPATIAGMGAVRGMAVANDGTLYVADSTYHVVRAISPAGEMTVVAGRSGTQGFDGDGGLATMALLRAPSGLALDEAAGFLYIADTGNHRVRVVNLATGTIATHAGGGGAGAPDYGDGGSATAATLSSPGHVRLGPDGALYVADTGRHRIRRIDGTTGIISTWLAGGSGTCSGATVSLYGCQSELRTCDVAWDAAGRAFISGYFCGSEVGSNTWAVVRREADGTLVRVAGVASGLTADGSPAQSALLNGAGSLAFDGGGNLLILEHVGHRVRRIDGASGALSTVVGTGTAGDGTDYVAALGQPLNTPWDLAFDRTRHLYVSESSNNVVRSIWELGAASASSARLEVVAGTPQTTEVNRLLPLAFTVRLSAGGTPLIGLPVTFRAVDEGGGLNVTTATTTPMGTAGVFGRPGLSPGLYRFTASFEDLHGVPAMGSPVTFEVTAVEPAPGTIFTAVNIERTAGAVPGAGPYARVGQLAGIAIASDGTVYAADRTQHRVWRLSPRGELSVLAGTGSSGFLGDGGPALDARLNGPTGLALDEAAGVLYVADRGNHRVRSIDLTTGIIHTVAGGGSTSMPAPYGDGGPATSAYIANPGNVAVGPDGRVYISDTGHNRIRQLDPVTGIIDEWLTGTTTGCASTPLQFYGCATNATSCHVLFEPDGTAYISGQLCGNTAPLTTSAAYGIVRRAPDGTLTHVAGRRSGETSDGVDASMASIGGAGWLARDPSGALHYADFGSHRIRRIDPTTNTVSTIAGNGTAGFAGEHVTAIISQLSTPWGIAFNGEHLFIADSGNVSLRVIW